MTNSKKTDKQPNFSRRFNTALIIARLTDAMVEADGWRLDQFTEAPAWLKALYNRHADAACKEMSAIEREENTLKPSEHN